MAYFFDGGFYRGGNRPGAIYLSDDHYNELQEIQKKTTKSIFFKDGLFLVADLVDMMDSVELFNFKKQKAKEKLNEDLSASRVFIRGHEVKARPQDEQNLKAILKIMDVDSLDTYDVVNDDEVINLTKNEIESVLEGGLKYCENCWTEYKNFLKGNS